MGNTTSSQHAAEGSCGTKKPQAYLQYQSANVAKKRSEEHTTAKEIIGTAFDNDEFHGFEDPSDTDAMPLDQCTALLSAPYEPPAVVPSIELDQDVSMNQSTRATKVEISCDGHEEGCDGARGHSTPIESSPLPDSVQSGQQVTPKHVSTTSQQQSTSVAVVQNVGKPISTTPSPRSSPEDASSIEDDSVAAQVDPAQTSTTSTQQDEPAKFVSDRENPSLLQPSPANSGAKYAHFPDPERDISKQLKYYRKLHESAKAALPREKLAWHRYWIVVIPEGKNHRTPNARKEFLFFTGHRLITGETMRRMYGKATASDDVQLLLGYEKVKDTERMEELDLCNSKLIVLRCVRSRDVDRLAKKSSDGLVLPEVRNPLITDTRPVEIIDEE